MGKSQRLLSLKKSYERKQEDNTVKKVLAWGLGIGILIILFGDLLILLFPFVFISIILYTLVTEDKEIEQPESKRVRR